MTDETPTTDAEREPDPDREPGQDPDQEPPQPLVELRRRGVVLGAEIEAHLSMLEER